MIPKMCILSVLVCSFVIATVGVNLTFAIEYECTEIGTVVVFDLPDTSISFEAEQADGSVCNTTGDYTELHITGCPKGSYILLTYSGLQNMTDLGIQGGPTSAILNITCYEISEAGVDFEISNPVHTNFSFHETKTLSPLYSISSGLNATVALLGEPILWAITFPTDYHIEMVSCKAYPGTTYSSDPVTLITYWCSEDTELISHFEYTQGSGKTEAVMKAFKFHDNDFTFLACDIKICPAINTCQLQCTKKKRGIRNAKDASDDSSEHATVGTVLRVVDTLFNGMTAVSGSTTIVLATALILPILWRELS